MKRTTIPKSGKLPRKKLGSGFREISSDDFTKGKSQNLTFILIHTVGHDANFTINMSPIRDVEIAKYPEKSNVKFQDFCL